MDEEVGQTPKPDGKKIASQSNMCLLMVDEFECEGICTGLRIRDLAPGERTVFTLSLLSVVARVIGFPSRYLRVCCVLVPG